MNYKKGKPVMFEITEINQDEMVLTFSDKKYIRISEEDFDNACRDLTSKYVFTGYGTFMSYLKEELFKDVK